MGRTVSILICAVSLAVILIIVLVYPPMRDRRNLERFLKEIAVVEIGKTAVGDFRTKTAQAHVSNLAFDCRQQDCSVGMQTENRLLHRLRLAPLSIAVAGVGFKNGIASEIYVAFVIGRRNEQGEWRDDKGVVVRQSTDRPSACHPHYELSVKQRYRTGDRYWATVAMDSCASAEDRAKAVAIDGACLTRIGGCKTVEDVIPQAFARP
jgi:hypothetical protein